MVEQKAIIELVEQEYLAYLFLNNSNQKMHAHPIAKGCGK
jgi:hypothetical protein